MAKSTQNTSYINPFMDQCKHFTHGASVLINNSRPLILIKTRLNLVCIRRCRKTWWCYKIFQIDGNLLIWNDVGILSSIKLCLSTQLQTKIQKKCNIFLGLRSLRTVRMGKLCYATYIDKHLVKCIIQNYKKGLLPFRHGVHFSQVQCSYAFIVANHICAMLLARLDICFSVGVVSRYKVNPRLKFQVDVKHIIKYPRKMRECMFVRLCDELILLRN